MNAHNRNNHTCVIEEIVIKATNEVWGKSMIKINTKSCKQDLLRHPGEQRIVALDPYLNGLCSMFEISSLHTSEHVYDRK